jgi:hypothetical protein
MGTVPVCLASLTGLEVAENDAINIIGGNRERYILDNADGKSTPSRRVDGVTRLVGSNCTGTLVVSSNIVISF